MTDDVKLVAFDMEGTLTRDPTVWELMHRKNGTWDSHGANYWQAYKAGAFGYDEFARKDVAVWRNASAQLLDEAVADVALMPGCRELFDFLSANGIRSAILSNGLERLARRLQDEFSIARVAANRATVNGGRLTGEVEIRVPFDEKGTTLTRIISEMGLSRGSVAAVGDGVADIGMFRSAGRSIAFLPESAAVAAEADGVVEDADLRSLIPFLE